jgi:hypothetical protein
MAGSPPVDPPETGASGLGGGDVDPEHALIYTGKWPFGDPLNPRPDADSPGVTELHVSPSADGGGSIFDDMFPFKLQWFIDDDPKSDTYMERKLRIYTGRLTAMINTFTYSKKKDTDTRYAGELDVASYTGSVCYTGDLPDGENQASVSTTTTKYIDNNPANGTKQDEEDPLIAQFGGWQDAEVVNTTTGTAVGGATSSVSHTHSVTIPAHDSHSHSIPDHYHDVPSHSHALAEHRHWAKGQGESDPELCDLSVSKTRCDVEKFLTIGGQPEIQEPLQIEPDGFADVTIEVDGEDVPTGFRAQTLPDTYGKVWLTWDLNTAGGLDGDVDDVVVNVNITMVPHVADDPDTPEDESDNDPTTTKVGALAVTHWEASRAPALGNYKLLIGTTFDPEGEDDQVSSKGIVQVIYENVYYSPLILPPEADSSGPPSCDSPESVDWNG